MNPRSMRTRLLEYAQTKPEAHLEHPWGEDVVKVRGKIFAFFGMPDGDEPGMGAKLPESSALALSQPGVTPTGYGLGKAGWVSVRLDADMSLEMLRDWIDESYRAVAPKKLLRELEQLDQGASSDSSTPVARR